VPRHQCGICRVCIKSSSILYSQVGKIGDTWHLEERADKLQRSSDGGQLRFDSKLPRVRDGDLVISDASEDYDGVGKSVEVEGIGDGEVVAGLHTILLRSKPEFISNGFKGYLQFISALK
jgi:hypothetical protein